MPKLQSIFDATVPVEVTHGDTKITFKVAIERGAQKPEELKVLFDKDQEIRQALAKLGMDCDLALNKANAITTPGIGELSEFRVNVLEPINTALSALRPESGRAKTTEAINALEGLPDQIEAWCLNLIPSDSTIEENTQKAMAEVEAKRGEIEKKKTELHRNRAAQIAFWCIGWDVTEDVEGSDKDVPVEITPELLTKFSPDYLIKIWGEVEKKAPVHSLIL